MERRADRAFRQFCRLVAYMISAINFAAAWLVMREAAAEATTRSAMLSVPEPGN